MLFVGIYLTLNLIVIGVGIFDLVQHPETTLALYATMRFRVTGACSA